MLPGIDWLGRRPKGNWAGMPTRSTVFNEQFSSTWLGTSPPEAGHYPAKHLGNITKHIWRQKRYRTWRQSPAQSSSKLRNLLDELGRPVQAIACYQEPLPLPPIRRPTTTWECLASDWPGRRRMLSNSPLQIIPTVPRPIAMWALRARGSYAQALQSLQTARTESSSAVFQCNLATVLLDLKPTARRSNLLPTCSRAGPSHARSP